MRKAVVASLAVALIFGVKSCGEPYDAAKDSVEEFMEEVKEGEGSEAIRYLHPSFRDNLAKDLKLPVQFTELKPSEVLSCLLSSMGANIDEVDVKEGKLIGENTAIIKVKVEDKNGVDKLFSFVLIKEEDRWLIADITTYVPELKKDNE
ncbi:DUF4878 domain-containing protein [Hydrogenivirga sp.]